MPPPSVRRRLRAVASQLACPAAAVGAAPDQSDRAGIADVGRLPDARGTGLYSEPRLLTNAQMAEFLAQGYLSLPVDDVVSIKLSCRVVLLVLLTCCPAAPQAPSVHRELHANAERAWQKSGGDGGAGLGNNIWPALPQLGDVLRSSVVHGFVHSILGEGYTMNAHRHMHDSSKQGDQKYHKGARRRARHLDPARHRC